MFLVLRSAPSYQIIGPMNSLAYLGLLWVKNEEQWKIIETTSPIEILQCLSVPMHSREGNNNDTIFR
jgi:ATP adenylyltransferase/5',5'''-P-1,P-4-tetraphosphate phosphorylase II